MVSFAICLAFDTTIGAGGMITMDLNKNLEKYADLLVRIGLNLHEGDNLTIRLSEYALPLARLIARKAYQAGVGDIQLVFNDDAITLSRFLEARDESFETYPEYQVDFAEKLFLDNHHVLNLHAPNPDLLKPADPANCPMAESRRHGEQALDEIYNAEQSQMVRGGSRLPGVG